MREKKSLIFGVVFVIVLLSVGFASAANINSNSHTYHKINFWKGISNFLSKATGHAVLSGSSPIKANDLTPRIEYWWGKVNQHINKNGTWITDADGVSGANLDKLTYCKKFYPNTISVKKYKKETIYGWRNRGNVDGPFMSTKLSYECVQGNKTINDTVKCIDSDGGLNYYIKGNVFSSTRSDLIYNDQCMNSTVGTLREYYCNSNSTVGYVYYNCSNGCANGACVQTTSIDLTPRIEYWWGKVNQHINKNGTWVTDPDGKSGANLDKLTYCKKFYPNTISVKSYKNETITTWRNGGNRGGPFTSTRLSYECVSEKSNFNLSISIATLKKAYSVGEVIKLTDPPEKFSLSKKRNLQRGGIKIETKLMNLSSNRPSVSYVQKTSSILKEKSQNNFSQGYIVQLNGQSIVNKESELNQIAFKNERYTGLPVIGPVFGLFMVSSNEVPTKISEYSNNLKIKHKQILNKMGDVLYVKNNSITGNAVSNSKSLPIERDYAKTFNGFLVNLTSNQIEKIKNISGVKAVYPNYRVHSFLMDSVPLIQNNISAGKMNPHGNTCMKDNGTCLTGKNVTIAVIDTGVDYEHPDLGNCTQNQFLSGNCSKVVGGWNFVSENSNPLDDNGHGTHVASIAAGNGDWNHDGKLESNEGLNGVAPGAKILAYKVLDSKGSGYVSDVLSGIEMAVDPNNDGNFSDHVDIISMSLGGPGSPSDPLSQAINTATKAGVVSVFAGGNSGPGEGTIGSPGTAKSAITVGATYKKNYNQSFWWENSNNSYVDQVTSFSSRGPVSWIDDNGTKRIMLKPDIVAPGALICAARLPSFKPWNEDDLYKSCKDNKHVLLAGTSMATPIVSGSVAILKEAHPDWTPQQIKSDLMSTAKKLKDPFTNQNYSKTTQGAGRIDLANAVKIKGKPLVSLIQTSGEFSTAKPINIFGTADGSNFINYSLFVSYIPSISGEGWGTRGFLNNQKNWKKVCSGNLTVEDSSLCKVNPRDFKEGFYDFKLVVNGKSEKSVSYSFIDFVNTKISAPLGLNREAFNLNKLGDSMIYDAKEFPIYGTAAGPNFQGYSLSYVSLDKNLKGNIISSNSSVNHGILGKWKISKNLSSGFYNLILINHYSGKKVSSSVRVYVDKSLHPGWPKNANLDINGNIGLASNDQPTISDINGDGKEDLIIAYGNSMNVFDENGKSLPGWPVQIHTNYSSNQPAIMQDGPAVARLKNGQKEIIVSDNAGYLHVFDSKGNLIWKKKIANYLIGAPTISDFNGDWNLEIIWSDFLGRVSAVYLDNGTFVPGFPVVLNSSKNYPYNVMSPGTVSVSDLFHNGKKELIVATSSSNSSTDSPNYLNGASQIWVLSDKGKVLEGWPKELPYLYYNNPVVADLNKNGQEDIIVGDSNGTLYALNPQGGNVPGWPIYANKYSSVVSLNYIGITGISVGDLNHDSSPEVVFTGRSVKKDLGEFYFENCLWVSNSSGKIINGFPDCGVSENFSMGFDRAPILANVDKDSQTEILPGMGSATYSNWLIPYYAIKYNSSIVQGFPKYLKEGVFGNVIPAGDIDGDGLNEFFLDTLDGNNFLFDTPGNSSQNEWPQFQHDAQHTGCYDCNFSYQLIGISLPHSEIVNNENNTIKGELILILQKKTGLSWANQRVVSDKNITIPSKGIIKLDVGGDYGWNLKNISVNSSGEYRTYAKFEDGSNNVESFWKFNVTD